MKKNSIDYYSKGKKKKLIFCNAGICLKAF